MKKIYLFLIMTLVVLLFSGSVDATDYGKEWLNLPRWSQTWYIAGFVDGYFKGLLVGHNWGAYYFKCETLPSLEGFPRLKRPDCNTQQRLLPKQLKFTGLDYRVIADVMTQFYKDPANRLISHYFICELAIQKLSGTGKEEVERQVEYLRSSATKTWEQLLEETFKAK